MVKLNNWAGNELNKSIVNGYCTCYTVKESFDDLRNAGADEEFGGDVMMWMIEPNGAIDDQIIIITCKPNGVFKNDRYEVGVIASDNDMENKIKEL